MGDDSDSGKNPYPGLAPDAIAPLPDGKGDELEQRTLTRRIP